MEDNLANFLDPIAKVWGNNFSYFNLMAASQHKPRKNRTRAKDKKESRKGLPKP